MKPTLKNDHGIAMVINIILMAVLLSITGAGLLFSALNLKSASNLKTGIGALHVADAGVQHALAVIPEGTTFAYGAGSTVVSTTAFPTSSSGYSYVITATNNPATSPTTFTAILASEGNGPNSSKKKVEAYIGRSSVFTPPGAVYMPGQAQYIETNFGGSSFAISGRDSNPGEAEGSGSASPVPGIATTDSSVTNEISSGGGTLDSSQYGQVRGEGSDPSVDTSSRILDVNQIADDILALGIEGVTKQTLNGGLYSSGQWGTSLLPKITYLTNANVQLTGTLTGYGVLIVNGKLTTRGNFNFYGLVIARGDVDFNGSGQASDAATIWGALLIKRNDSSDPDQELRISGSGKVFFSSQTLAKVMANWGSAIPTPPKLIAWHEVMQ